MENSTSEENNRFMKIFLIFLITSCSNNLDTNLNDLPVTPPFAGEKCEDVYDPNFRIKGPEWDPGRGVKCTHMRIPKPWVDLAYCRCK